MPFEIKRAGDSVFLIRCPSGQCIRPAATHEVVLQLVQEFQIDPKGIRFFWPDDDDIDMIVAVLRDLIARRPS